MKCQKYSEREPPYEIGEVLRYPKEKKARLKIDWQVNKQFAQLNVY